ncbi:lysophospholipid acyltransferase family protein [Amnibacterium kyonggiense]|uniref:1-acyl-sn-glycerol-3-phosphate acyltransferase n=1 Tax=Amnibacterium kyonggiense TaxID=595671 RepID=A0A4R7FJ51_9MICO|nr:lysophospholipid acyltransferase family protein [Amnibacterium kyonggiense]TDS75656.1 1-acyl-sn-glycerol-3-phosphate acyltransferase [Amnibacterium kyonggiense]
MTTRVTTKRPVGSEPPAVRFDRYTSKPMAAARWVAQRVLLGGVVRSVVRVRILGRERLSDLRGAFVVVANHTSHLDAPLLCTTLPRRLARYISVGAAADYFFDVRWRKGLTALFFNAFPIHRAGINRPASEARSLLARGVPLIIFPEGTRSRTGKIGQFKVGAAALASQSNVPMLPVAIIGAHAAHPRGSKWPKAGRPPVAVVFGDPVFAQTGETPTEYMRRVRGEVQRLHDEHAPAVLSRGRTTSGGPR